jgi:predicted RNase H-like nuclease
MKFIGIDLAWTERGRTGICLAEDGVAVASALVRTDEEILSWTRSQAHDNCLVAIDAPLIVRNDVGRRPCERILSRCFSAQHAGPHSANLRLPSFREGVRGERVARAMGLDLDPYFAIRSPVRRAIEVYPHPALVALFELPLSIKYKAKRGRTIVDRQQAFRVLLDLMEGLVGREPAFDVTASPSWSQLRSDVEAPASGAALDRVEDEIDAYLCAYVSQYYWFHGETHCRVVGDLNSGYIVTPVAERHAACIDRGLAEA